MEAEVGGVDVAYHDWLGKIPPFEFEDAIFFCGGFENGGISSLGMLVLRGVPPFLEYKKVSY